MVQVSAAVLIAAKVLALCTPPPLLLQPDVFEGRVSEMNSLTVCNLPPSPVQPSSGQRAGVLAGGP